jgi:hypothetical protein
VQSEARVVAKRKHGQIEREIGAALDLGAAFLLFCAPKGGHTCKFTK